MSEMKSEVDEDGQLTTEMSRSETLVLSDPPAPEADAQEEPLSSPVSPQHGAETPRLPSSASSSQLQLPGRSRPGTPLLAPLDLTRCETPLLAHPLNLSQMDMRFISVQDISEMETPFLPVPPLPDSPTETPLLPPLPLLTGYPAVPGVGDWSDNGIHSCLSSASCLASAMSTPMMTRKFRSNDSDTGTDLLPVCRICQLPGDKEDFLFSPCRCSGTMMFVHYLCLLKWIEISTRKTKRPPKCELCHFQYIRHKRFKFHHWRFPRVSSRDKCLHTVFFINLIIMMSCAVATILCFLSDKGHLQELPRGGADLTADKQVELTTQEIITLTCGIMFFVSFFIAMTVEIKARHTIYRLFLKFLSHNTEWQIEPYQRAKDFELHGVPQNNYV
ncbi:E3 ubiquitin-protein ligase MARCHF4-like [Littorina saxatilis]|uniref:RING-CH-type domain-containing protein n=1 Tax=Littorina saxatilis TaxID=31220 RepID=A0AAN9GAW2_9CAEN